METPYILAIIAGILFILHFGSRGVVWVFAIIGAGIGLIVALLTDNWSMLALIFAIGTFIGTFFEWVNRLSKRISRG